MDRGAWKELVKDWALAGGITLAVLVGWRMMQPTPVTTGPAPALEALDPEGGSWSLDDATADLVVVNFWATWCGPCRREIPELSAFAAAHDDVELVGVSVDRELSTDAMARSAARMGITYRVVHDPDLVAAGAWGVTGYPTTFVLDAHRHVVATRYGALTQASLGAMVEQARHAHGPVTR